MVFQTILFKTIKIVFYYFDGLISKIIFFKNKNILFRFIS